MAKKVKKIKFPKFGGETKYFINLNKNEDEFDFSDILEFKTLEEFLHFCAEEPTDFTIYIIPPVGKFKKYKSNIILFPLSMMVPLEKGEAKIYHMRDTVLYDGKLHNHDEFFKDNELINTERLLEELAPDVVIKVLFSTIILPFDVFMDIKKECFTPLRRFFSKFGMISDTRGKYKSPDKMKILRERFIKSQYKKLGQSKRIPIKTLQKRWIELLCEMYPDDPEMAEKYDCSDATIRRIVAKPTKKNAYIKKLTF